MIKQDHWPLMLVINAVMPAMGLEKEGDFCHSPHHQNPGALGDNANKGSKHQ